MIACTDDLMNVVIVVSTCNKLIGSAPFVSLASITSLVFPADVSSAV